MQEDDLNRVWQSVGHTMDTLQNMLTFFEGNNKPANNANAGGPGMLAAASQVGNEVAENLIRQAGEQLKRVQITIFKRNANQRRLNLNHNTTNNSTFGGVNNPSGGIPSGKVSPALH